MNTMLKYILMTVGILSSFSALGQNGYDIKVKVNNYKHDTLLLGYYLGDKQYVKDTAISKTGSFVFSGKSDLDPGVYMAVLLPTKNVFQFIVDQKNSHMSLEVDAHNLSTDLKVKNSPENVIFFEYIQFLSSQKIVVDSLRRLSAMTNDSLSKVKYNAEISKVDVVVSKFQDDFSDKHKGSFTSKLIKASKIVPMQQLTNEDDAYKLKVYNAYKASFFNDFDFADQRLFRSPIYFQKIDGYIQNITVQHPDSLNRSLDFILNKVSAIPDAFKFYLSHYFNFYVKSKYVGMDAVYVHLIDEYYLKGKADWIDAENLTKMRDAANSLRPTLVGKIAPNLTLNKQDSTLLQIHEIKSPYTVLFFWAPDCGHCEKAVPHILEFYEQFKDKGVTILAICTGLLDEAKDCWTGVKKKHMEPFINVNDPVLLSNFKQLYNIKTTPQFFILDKDKRILTKGIGAEQLSDVMGKIIIAEQYNRLK